ncbi:MAG: serine hydrolase domain-containing protein [Candidatus Korobacteraceae bacterium]
MAIALLTEACSAVSTPSTQTASTPTTSPGTRAAPRLGSTTGASRLRHIDQTALQAMVDTTAHELLIPGAVVLLRTPQGEFTVVYGTTLLGAKIPPSTDTYFRIASNTKTMTAAVIMQLVEEGKLSLDDPVSKYIAGVPNGADITIAELLEMRSGLCNYTNAPEISATIDRNPTKVWTPAELLAIAFAHPPNFPPGTAYEYCNTNYALLGMIAEKVDRKPLAQAMHDRLFAPLHLQHTELPAPAVNTIPKPYSHGYLYGSSSVALVGEPPYTPEQKAAARAGTLRPKDYTDVNHSVAMAAGGAISTANDLATWIKALVTGRVLNAKYQSLWLDSLRPEDPSKPKGQRYGYGISQMSWGPNTIYFHGGETPGYNSFIGYDPNNKVTLVVWTNLPVSLDDQPTANALMLKVLDQIYEVSPLAPPPSSAANH